MNSTVIHVEELCFDIKQNSRRILNDINFSLEREEFLVVMGSNGSGKSTLLKCINSELMPTKGKITIDKSIQKDEIVCLSQSVNEHLCLGMTIAEHMRLYLMSHQDRKVSTFDQFEYLSGFSKRLVNYYNKPVRHLSGGEKQILIFALLLLKKPKVLLLDEHTSALDPKMSRHVMNITSTMIRRKKLSVVMITHDVSLAADYGDRTFVMHEGKLEYDPHLSARQKKNE